MKLKKRLISVLLFFSMVLSLVVMPVQAIDAGEVYAPDMDAWGTQNNNGWYYMYQGSDGQYKQLDYYDDTAGIDWQKNAFAFDPNTMGEMLFMAKDSFFTGELGSKPVYAFQAPEGGQVELTVLTHGTDDMRMEILKNNESKDTIAFNTTGPEAGFTRTTLTLDVGKDDWIYLVGSTTGANRQGWVKDYSVEYLTVDSGEDPEPEEPEDPEPEDPEEGVTVGDIYAPDMNAWGTQDNNGWYYMYRSAGGQYAQLDYYDDTAEIDWQKNAFAFDPYTMGEMLFMTKDSFFTGELGSQPVYAFCAPSGGQVELTVLTHGTDDMRMEIFLNNESKETIAFNTTGPEAGFTKTTLTLDVARGTWIYLVGSTTGTNRQGWVKDYSVEYLAVNEEEEKPDESIVCAPDMDAWGTQNNNGWYYMFRNSGGQYQELDYYDGTSEIDWQKNAFAFDPYEMNEMLFINRNSFVTGELGSLPVYAFCAPVGGQIELTVLTHGTEDMHMEVLKNDETIDSVQFNTTGSIAGFTKHTWNLEVKKGTWIYLACSTTGENREGWVKDYSVRYLSTNEEVEVTEERLIYTPDMDAWGIQNNNGWYYLSKGLDNVYSEMTYRDDSALIDWQRNAFASDPNVAQEMYFIARQKFFVGEMDTKPVYAFLCPQGGQIELTFVTSGDSGISMQLMQNKELLDTVHFSTDGPEAGYTRHVYQLDVKKGTWIYLIGDRSGEIREGNVSYYGIEYLSVNDAVETEDNSLIGKVFTPDMDQTKQNNNGWYYMYFDNLTQRYEQLEKYGADAEIEWQRNAFAFDPSLMFEMLFMTNEHYFTGENGSCPVYAFQCPSGGRVRLKVFTHGKPDMYMKVFYNATLLDTYQYSTDGSYNGFTKHELELDVKEGGWIYLVCGSNGEDRDGWLNFYGVEYLTENEAVETYSQPHVYTPDITDGWGVQNNNNWNFEFLDKEDGFFKKLAYVRRDQNFQGTAEGGYEYLLIKQIEMHPSVKGNPAKVFSCPEGGTVQLSFQAWMQAAQLSPTGTGIAVYHNGTKIWPENEDYHKLDSSIYLKRLTVDVAAGDDLAIMIDALEDNVSYDATNVRCCAEYQSTNEAVRTEWPQYPEEERPEVENPSADSEDSSEETEEPVDVTEPTETEPEEETFPVVVVVVGLAAVAIVLIVIIGVVIFIQKKKKVTKQ